MQAAASQNEETGRPGERPSLGAGALVYTPRVDVRFTVPRWEVSARVHAHGTKPTISFSRRTEVEAFRVHEIELRRQGLLLDLYAAGSGGGGGRGETREGFGRGIRFRFPAARYQGAPGPIRHSTGRSEEGALDRGLRSLQPRQLPAASGKRGCGAGGGDGVREAECHPGRADGCGENLFDQTHRGADQSAVCESGRDEV